MNFTLLLGENPSNTFWWNEINKCITVDNHRSDRININNDDFNETNVHNLYDYVTLESDLFIFFSETIHIFVLIIFFVRLFVFRFATTNQNESRMRVVLKRTKTKYLTTAITGSINIYSRKIKLHVQFTVIRFLLRLWLPLIRIPKRLFSPSVKLS